jgi:predicted PolB exonuclease-like 3'-5' exonuclease
MKYLVFDFETVPDPEHTWKPPEDQPDKFPPIPVHKIVSIGGMLISVDEVRGSSKNKVLWFGNFGTPDDELSMILGFLKMCEDETPELISYNGRGFDLCVLEHRCMRWGVSAPYLFEWNLRNRFKEQGHMDLQDLLTNFGASFRSKLSDICVVLGMPGKMDVDGSKVDEMIAAGKQQEVDSYCLCDVAETAWLLIRFLHLRGDISSVTNYNAVHAIKSACIAKKDEMLDKLVEMTNIDRLSLEEQKESLEQSKQGSLFEQTQEDDEDDPDIPF